MLLVSSPKMMLHHLKGPRYHRTVQQCKLYAFAFIVKQPEYLQLLAVTNNVKTPRLGNMLWGNGAIFLLETSTGLGNQCKRQWRRSGARCPDTPIVTRFKNAVIWIHLSQRESALSQGTDLLWSPGGIELQAPVTGGSLTDTVASQSLRGGSHVHSLGFSQHCCPLP